MSLTDYITRIGTTVLAASILAGTAYAQQPVQQKQERIDYLAISPDLNKDGRPDVFAIGVYKNDENGKSKRYEVGYVLETKNGGKGEKIDSFVLPSSICFQMFIPTDVNGDGFQDIFAMFGNCDKTGKYDKHLYLNDGQGRLKKQ